MLVIQLATRIRVGNSSPNCGLGLTAQLEESVLRQTGRHNSADAAGAHAHLKACSSSCCSCYFS